MDVISRLTVKNLRLNRKRSISTMLGIILSMALICATCTMGTSFRRTMVNETIETRGYYHIRLDRLSEEDCETLANNRDFLPPHTVRESGYAILEGCKNPNKPYTKLWAMDEETFNFLHFKLIDGHFPENDDEIVISRHILTDGKMDLKLGGTLTLEVGERQTADGEPLNAVNAYHEGEELIADAKSCNYRIVGIIDRPNNLFETYLDPCYTSIIGSKEGQCGELSAFLTLKNPYHYKETFCELLDFNDYQAVETHSFEGSAPRYKDYLLNLTLLQWESFSIDDNNAMDSILSILIIVVGIIMLTSIFCIRNSFAISTTEKIRMYGMLASVGATRRQIRRCVLLEGFFLGTIAIPVGIVSGLFADYVLISMINWLLATELNVDLVLSVSGFVVVLSVVLGFLTIFASAFASARRAAKVSPIAQLQNAQDIRLDEKELRIPRWVKKIFRIGGVLAYKNLRRSKRKYRTTVVSLTVSIFSFITMNAFVENIFDSSESHAEITDCELQISAWAGSSGDNSLTEQEILQIQQMERVGEALTVYCTSTGFCILDSERLIDPPEYLDQGYDYNMPILALDDSSFRAYAKRIGADYDVIRQDGILCDNAFVTIYSGDDHIRQRLQVFNYREGELIEGYYYPSGFRLGGKPKVEGEERVPYSVRIGAVTDIPPFKSPYDGSGFLVCDRAFADPGLHFTFSQMLIRSDDPDALENELIKAYPEIYVENYARKEREERSFLLIIDIFLYGFITVITLIGVTNIFNTITSNMELRQKEFAMLKSIGMTKHEFNRMIRLETLFYCTKALLYGVVLGLLGTFALYRAFSIALTPSIYIPLVPILVSAVFVFAFVFLIMRYSMAKLGRQNVIETIRNENV